MPATFQVILKESQIFWTCLTTRETIGADYETMYPSMVQRVYQLGIFWLQASAKRNGSKKLSEEDLYDAFQANLTVTAGERLTPKFVKVALHCFRQVINIDQLKRLLIAADETFGKRNPLDSLYKLQSLVQCAQSQTEGIKWALETMCDLLLNGKIQSPSLTLEVLGGKRGSKGRLGAHRTSFY